MQPLFYPSIHQLKDTLKAMEKYKAGPTTFSGTIKLHGTNGGICFTRETASSPWEITFKSRTRMLAPGKDNHGFHAAMTKLQSDHLFWTTYLANILPVAADVLTVNVFGEWCGKKINDKVGAVELERFFYVFAVAFDGEFTPIAFPPGDDALRVWSVDDAPKFIINLPAGENEARARALEVENACPFTAKIAALDGIKLRSYKGEGIVWSSGRYTFKTKGTLLDHTFKKSVVANPIPAFVQTLLKSRLDQGWDDECVSDIGEFLKWVAVDTCKECTPDINNFIAANPGVTKKSVDQNIAKQSANYFKERLR